MHQKLACQSHTHAHTHTETAEQCEQPGQLSVVSMDEAYGGLFGSTAAKPWLDRRCNICDRTFYLHRAQQPAGCHLRMATTPGCMCRLVCCLQAGTESAQHPQLYTVLEQRKASVGGGLLGTEHTYVIPGAETAAGGKRK